MALLLAKESTSLDAKILRALLQSYINSPYFSKDALALIYPYSRAKWDWQIVCPRFGTTWRQGCSLAFAATELKDCDRNLRKIPDRSQI